jgi:hypothetical protein
MPSLACLYRGIIGVHAILIAVRAWDRMEYEKPLSELGAESIYLFTSRRLVLPALLPHSPIVLS